jgi:predicted transcriptional regulator
MDGPNVLKHWQMEETKNALAAADRGNFASEEQVRLAIKPWAHCAGDSAGGAPGSGNSQF